MALIIEKLSVKIEGKQVIRDFDLNLGKGEVVALMGPNGSGKSSLSNAVMGFGGYEVMGKSKVSLDKKILKMSIDERAKSGLFLLSQYPVGVEGVRVSEVLITALRARGKKVKALDVKRKAEELAVKLGMDKSMVEREINVGFSGGEKKKMEVLQLLMLEPKYIILDEVDSGLDVDAIKVIAKILRDLVTDNKVGLLVITHYGRFLQYLKPNRVVVIKGGRKVDEGGAEKVRKLEREGYKLLKDK